MIMKQIGTILLIGLLVVLTGSLSAAKATDELTDQILEKARIHKFQILTEDGTTSLEGQAVVLKDKLEAQRIAERYLKVEVVNNIVLMPAPHKTDGQITIDVVAQLRNNLTRSRLFNTLSVETKEGRVLLTGRVRDAYLSELAEEAATEVVGVQAVENQIEVLPASLGDDRMRFAVYRRLAGRFPNYFVGAQPSINIVVDYGRVTLVGFVNSEVDRQMAGVLTRQMAGILEVNNQLKVD